MKHTPGPWQIDDMGDSFDVITNSDHPLGPTWIAKVISGYDGDIENAKLIAAAPTLLEACSELLAEWDADHADEDHRTGITPETYGIQLIRQAIKKASE